MNDMIDLSALASTNGGSTYRSTDEQCADLKTPKTVAASFMIAFVIIGLIGNGIVFFVILVLKEYKKSVSNWYILQLALADTLFLLMLPFGASEKQSGYWYHPLALCKAKEGILMVNYYASILFLTMMSFDRYMAVTKSGVSRWADVLRRLDSAALISLLIWLISIGLAIPIYLYSHITECDHCSFNFPRNNFEKCMQMYDNATACLNWDPAEENDKENITDIYNYYYDFRDIDGDFKNIISVDSDTGNFLDDVIGNLTDTNLCITAAPQSYKTWLYLNFSVCFLLPFVLICIFYGLILHAMMGTATTSCTNQRKYRRRVTFMVLALVTLFVVSWLPWYAVMLAQIQGFNLHKMGCESLSDAVRILSYLNSALNPYFYSSLSTRFPHRLSSALAKTHRFTSTVSYRFGSKKRTGSTLHGVTFSPTLHQSSISRHT